MRLFDLNRNGITPQIETYNGHIIHLNPWLLQRQNITREGYAALVESHKTKFDLLDRMAACNRDDHLMLHFYARLIDNLEFLQQGLWRFRQDPNLHLFWHLPHCMCLPMANELRWHRIITGQPCNPYPIYALDCPIHGPQ